MTGTVSLNQLPTESAAPAGGIVHCYDPAQPAGSRDVGLAVTAFQGAFSSQTATYVFAAPNAASGVPTFRQLIASDIPTLAPINAASVTGTWNFAARPVFNGNTPYDAGNLNFASPPALGATAPNGGAFTTLSSTQNAAVFATNASAQSIPNGVFTTVTGWTAVTDRNSNWTASTGTFTAPRAGIYLVSGAITMASAAWPATGNLSIGVFKNGTEVAQASFIINAAVTSSESVTLASVAVSCAAGDALTFRVFQSQGAALAVGSVAVANWVSIIQTP